MRARQPAVAAFKPPLNQTARCNLANEARAILGKGNPAPIHKSIKKHIGKDVLPVKVLKICNPDYAYALLKDDESRYVSVMMPCSVSVYKKSDGKTYVANMRADKMGSLMGGVVAEVMDGPVSGDQAKMLEFLNPTQ